jgi:hypothetical protein
MHSLPFLLLDHALALALHCFQNEKLPMTSFQSAAKPLIILSLPYHFVES